MRVFRQTCGLVVFDDQIKLAKGVRLEEGYLLDGANGARHRVVSMAKPAVRQLRKSISYSEWEKYTGWLTTEQRTELIIFLDSIAALDVKRKFRRKLWVGWRRLFYRLQGIRLIIPSKRFQSGLFGIAKAVTLAMIPIFALVTVVMIGAWGLGLPVSQYFDLFVGSNLVLLVVVWSSMILHEYTHHVLAQPHSEHSQSIVRGLRVGLLHRRLPIRLEILSAILGPVVGMIYCLIVAMVLNLIFHNSTFVVTSLLVGIFHAVSWLPEFGDGKVIFSRLKNKRYKNAQTPPHYSAN